jgi:hypothetical protein
MRSSLPISVDVLVGIPVRVPERASAPVSGEPQGN